MKITRLRKFLKRLKPDDKIEVKWVDHYSTLGWDNVKINTPMYCLSVGYYHSNDDYYLYMMSSISSDSTGGIMARIKHDISHIRKLKP